MVISCPYAFYVHSASLLYLLGRLLNHPGQGGEGECYSECNSHLNETYNG